MTVQEIHLEDSEAVGIWQHAAHNSGVAWQGHDFLRTLSTFRGQPARLCAKSNIAISLHPMRICGDNEYLYLVALTSDGTVYSFGKSASMGGPIAISDDCDYADVGLAINAAHAYMKTKYGARRYHLSALGAEYRQALFDAVCAWGDKQGSSVREMFYCGIDVDKSPEELLSSIRRNSRRDYRRALKLGVTFDMVNRADWVHDEYACNMSLSERRGKPMLASYTNRESVLSGRCPILPLDAPLSMNASGCPILFRPRFFGAFFNEEMIAYLVFAEDCSVVSVSRLLDNAQHRGKEAMGGLFVHALMEMCKVPTVKLATYGFRHRDGVGTFKGRLFKPDIPVRILEGAI